MTLHVPEEGFVQTVRQVLSKEAITCVSLDGSGALLTAAEPAKGIIVQARTRRSLEAARAELVADGFTPINGSWSASDRSPDTDPSIPYIAAVAYKAHGDRPGVWMDAYPSEPTAMQVLNHLVAEFERTGEMKNVSFEEFMRLANPNVVVMAPGEIIDFLQRNEELERGEGSARLPLDKGVVGGVQAEI